MNTATDTRGLKRACGSCGIRFYDFNKRPIHCPNCETQFSGEIKLKGRRGRVAALDAEAEAAAAAKAKAAIPAANDDATDIEAREDGVVSLEDVAALEEAGDDADEDALVADDDEDDIGSLEELEEDDIEVPVDDKKRIILETRRGPDVCGASFSLPALQDTDIPDIVAKFEPLNASVSIHRESDGADWLVQVTSEEKIEADALNAVHKGDWQFQILPDTDWLAASYKQFPAFSVGPFFIYGSHHEGDVPGDQTGLQIDAATAFGSGEHGTTKGCLLAMLDLNDAGVCPWNVLDMGTGSGILGIAAHKTWKTPVLAVDNDEEAVRVACHHREINDVHSGSTGMICKAGDGFKTAAVQDKKPYDLIIANILAVVLREMVDELKAVSDSNGFIVLSGILEKQADEVIETYSSRGFKLHKRFDISGWSTLTLQNSAA